MILRRGDQVIVNAPNFAQKKIKAWNGVPGVISRVSMFGGRSEVSFAVGGQFVLVDIPTRYLVGAANAREKVRT